MSRILWGLMPVSVIGVMAILVLAYMLLHYLVIFPISDIRHVMNRQQSGDHQARAVRQSTQEFDDVAIAFNGMIEAISESENQFRNLVLGSIQGVYIHRDWNLLFANPALAEIFGYHSPDEILALGNVGSLLAPDEHERLWGYKNARKKGEFAPDVYEARGVKKDGSMICAEFRITSVDWHGTAAMQCVVIDITDRMNAERELLVHRDHLQDMIENATRKLKINAEELKEALAKEQKLSKLQREFVSMASHEFRTPLAIIDTTAQRMKSRADKNQLTSGDAIQRVEKIREAVKRMTRLMDSTLTAARMEEGKIEIDIGPCDIGGVIREVSERQQEVDEEHIISCDLDGLPETIQADTGALEQVLANLLSNAVKYAPDAPEIEVKAQAEKDHVVISVRDHGLGIDEDDLNRIGERFFRARTSTGIAGTGIGFNLARNLVEMHEGTISVESKKGEGSTFTIRLPITGPDLEKQADSRVA
jgi:PAS domain S-box-containing protein